MADPRRVAVLISGRGSNMQALVEQAEGYEVVLVASNRTQAHGLDWARSKDLQSWAWDSRGVTREIFDSELDRALRRHSVGTIALAGYMRLLSPGFVRDWQGRIVNIHPSLLPAYKGLDTHQRVLAAGDSEHGCSVHLVTEELDDGAILARAIVPVVAGDDASSLEQKVLAEEHKLYPAALSDFVRRRRKSAAGGIQPTISSGLKK